MLGSDTLEGPGFQDNSCNLSVGIGSSGAVGNEACTLLYADHMPRAIGVDLPACSGLILLQGWVSRRGSEACLSDADSAHAGGGQAHQNDEASAPRIQVLAPDQHKGEKWGCRARPPGRIVGRAKHPSNHCRPRHSKQSRRRCGVAADSQLRETQPDCNHYQKLEAIGSLVAGLLARSSVCCGLEVVAVDDCCCWAPREQTGNGCWSWCPDSRRPHRTKNSMVIAVEDGPAGSGSRRDNNAWWPLAGGATKQNTKRWRDAGSPHSWLTLLFPIHLNHLGLKGYVDTPIWVSAILKSGERKVHKRTPLS